MFSDSPISPNRISVDTTDLKSYNKDETYNKFVKLSELAAKAFSKDETNTLAVKQAIDSLYSKVVAPDNINGYKSTLSFNNYSVKTSTIRQGQGPALLKEPWYSLRLSIERIKTEKMDFNQGNMRLGS